MSSFYLLLSIYFLLLPPYLTSSGGKPVLAPSRGCCDSPYSRSIFPSEETSFEPSVSRRQSFAVGLTSSDSRNLTRAEHSLLPQQHFGNDSKGSISSAGVIFNHDDDVPPARLRAAHTTLHSHFRRSIRSGKYSVIQRSSE